MDFTSQICTTEEQSEQLLALGLKKETADMFLLKDHFGDYLPATLTDSIFNLYCKNVAWSLHRLLRIIPHNITHNNQEYRRVILKEWIVYKHPLEYEYAVVSNYDSIYDSCVSCIEWLIKEGYFNKEYLERI